MQEVASDDGLAPIAGQATSKPGDVGGLIAAVESKMSELMAWHGQQLRQIETDKTVLQAQAEQQHEEIKAQQKQLEERAAQIDKHRINLVELTTKLRAEESAMSREWSEVHRERESIQQRANDLAKQRERVDERAKSWLETTSAELKQPLKLAGSVSQDDAADRDAA